jgi:serine/threonine protein kinase
VCLVHRVPLVVEQDPFVGTVVAGRYRIEGVIGAGGMATVYRALSTLHERAVAIKLFRKELASDPKLRERFRREASSTRRLAHRNVVEIVDEGALDDGTPFLVMEYLEGKTLEAILRGNRGPLEIGRTVDLGLQLAAGLARAHDFQVLHRDLKPDNLFIVPLEDGAELLKILDFGIARSMNDARLTATGEIFGTPQYMAPERITTTESGPAADLYAVGCILFRCAVGRLPFVAGDVTSFLLQHLREPPPSPRALNPAVPPELDALILQCLQKDPARRPVDAHAIERALTELHGQHARQHPSGAFPAAELVNTARARAKALSATTAGGDYFPPTRCNAGADAPTCSGRCSPGRTPRWPRWPSPRRWGVCARRSRPCTTSRPAGWPTRPAPTPSPSAQRRPRSASAGPWTPSRKTSPRPASRPNRAPS